MSPRASGREALLDAAALLMDEHGVDQVSLNEINRASGQHNRSAVQYHFGSREVLVRELFTRTMLTMDAERNALLDHLETTGAPLTQRAAIEVIVGPLARRLHTPEGRRYLRLCGQLLHHPRYNQDARATLQLNTSITRSAQYIGPALAHLPRAIAIERASLIVGLTIRALADQARLIDTDPPPRPVLPTDTFASNLVDILHAMLTAPTTTDSST
jgi:AcrR family transcriptional regulator